MSGDSAADPTAERPARRPNSTEEAFLLGDPDAVELVFVRHGQQTHRAPVPHQPPSLAVDPPLTELGRRQVQLVGAWLSSETFDAVYSSPLVRANDTARAIAAPHGLEPVVYADLREVEIYRGLAEGVTLLDAIPDVLRRGAAARFARERRWDVFPQSESGRELRDRVVTIVEGIIASRHGHGGRIAVACHGGVINAYVAYVLGVPEDMVFMPAHTSITRVRAGRGRRVLHTANEFHHLLAAGRHHVTY